MSKKENEKVGKEFLEISYNLDNAEKRPAREASALVKNAYELLRKYGKSLSDDEKNILEKEIEGLREKCKKDSCKIIYLHLFNFMDAALTHMDQYRSFLSEDPEDYIPDLEYAEQPILYAIDDLSRARAKIREFEPFCDKETIENCKREIECLERECYTHHAGFLMGKASISAANGSIRETGRSLRNAVFRYKQAISLGPPIFRIDEDEIGRIIESARENYSGSRTVSYLASSAMKTYFSLAFPRNSKGKIDELDI